MKHHHHNRPGAGAVKLDAKQARAKHRKHGTHFDFDSTAIASGKAYKHGGATLTFTDGTTYEFPELSRRDLKNLAASDSVGKTFNDEIR